MLGQRLIELKVLTPAALEKAIAAQRFLLTHKGQSVMLGDVLQRMRLCSEADIARALALDNEAASSSAQAIELPLRIRRDMTLQVIGYADGVLSVATARPLNDWERQDIVDACEVQGVTVTQVAEERRDTKVILASFANETVDSQDLSRYVEAFNTDPERGQVRVSQLLDAVFKDALECRASDVHFIRTGDALTSGLFYRIDGEVSHRHFFTEDAMRALCMTVKERAPGIDPSDYRRPQDGRLSFDYYTRRIDVRLNATPIEGGESVITRILDPRGVRDDRAMLEDHPLVYTATRSIVNAPAKSSGLALITGPTGSGKSTFMYALVQSGDRLKRNFSTLEDPPEQIIPFVRQVAVSEQSGLTFATGLRNLMRQDVDVMLLGEIRDAETAEYSLRMTETGHLLLATLHTSSVSESISRLLGMQPESYRDTALLTFSRHFQLVSNQKLCRRLCQRCAGHIDLKELVGNERLLAEHLQDNPGLAGRSFGRATGIDPATGEKCPRCEGRGYFGRAMVPEVLALPRGDSPVRSKIYRLLAEGEAPERIFELEGQDGLFYYPRETAALSLLIGGVIDLPTVIEIIGNKLGGV